jgi:hypothetical protein
VPAVPCPSPNQKWRVVVVVDRLIEGETEQVARRPWCAAGAADHRDVVQADRRMRRGSGGGRSVIRGTRLRPRRAEGAAQAHEHEDEDADADGEARSAAGWSTGRAARRYDRAAPASSVECERYLITSSASFQAGEADQREAAAQQGAATPAVGQHAAHDERHREQDDQSSGRATTAPRVGHAGLRPCAGPRPWTPTTGGGAGVIPRLRATAHVRRLGRGDS